MTQITSTCVIPVIDRSKIPNIEVRNWVMLDIYSQGGFVKKTLLKELKIEGKSTTVTVGIANIHHLL